MVISSKTKKKGRCSKNIVNYGGNNIIVEQTTILKETPNWSIIKKFNESVWITGEQSFWSDYGK